MAGFAKRLPINSATGILKAVSAPFPTSHRTPRRYRGDGSIIAVQWVNGIYPDLERLKKYCNHSGESGWEAVFLGFGVASASTVAGGYGGTSSHRVFKHAPSLSLAKSPKILAPNGYIVFLKRSTAGINPIDNLERGPKLGYENARDISGHRGWHSWSCISGDGRAADNDNVYRRHVCH
jgi:hypothetical protein